MKDLTIEDCDTVLGEIERAFFDIPFENSQFQTEQFVINAQLTPARAYRAIGLRMFNRIRALREAQYGRMREDIDIEELQVKIDNPSTDEFERRRAWVDIEQKLESRRYTDKLINDALKELDVLYRHFKALPNYSRDEFEAEEREHFTQKLNRQLRGITGARESLADMQNDAVLGQLEPLPEGVKRVTG
jgi:hypothetical protein